MFGGVVLGVLFDSNFDRTFAQFLNFALNVFIIGRVGVTLFELSFEFGNFFF